MADNPKAKSKAVEDAVADLMKKIADIKPEFEIEVKRSGPSTAGHFGDWHDHFKDGGHFADGFGKTGG